MTHEHEGIDAVVAAAELHDTAIQHATAASMFLDVAVGRSTPESDGPSAEHVAMARQELGRCLVELRRIVGLLDPAGDHQALPRT